MQMDRYNAARRNVLLLGALAAAGKKGSGKGGKGNKQGGGASGGARARDLPSFSSSCVAVLGMAIDTFSYASPAATCILLHGT